MHFQEPMYSFMFVKALLLKENRAIQENVFVQNSLHTLALLNF